jgi:uncharacterized protein
MTEVTYIRASDAKSWSSCKRRAWYDHHPPEGFDLPEEGEFEQLIIQLGVRHEWGVKRKLEKEYQLVEAVSEQHTCDLMAAEVDIIYQPQFTEGDIIGKPDFLIRHESGEYQAADAKLARSDDKKEIQIQLGVYRKMMNNGLPALVFLGNGETVEIGDEADKLADKFLAGMREILANKTSPQVRYSESRCKPCPYYGVCKPEFKAKEEITLLYGVESRAAPGLEAQGITTISKMAESDPNIISDVPYLKGFSKRNRAVLQAKSYFDDSVHRLQDVVMPEGTWVHFGIETNPLADTRQEHVYLWGFLKPPYDHGAFEYVWTDHERDDEKGWRQFLDLVERYRQEYPDLILCHFSNYEMDKIKMYAKRYDMHEHPTVAWLLGDDTPLFDIKTPVTESFVLPLAGYGLKQICKHEGLVNFQWQDEDSGSQWSVVQFVKYRMELITDRRAQMKKEILTYNFDDVMATRKLEEWLRKNS